jgi:hypothetical protein
MLHRPPHLAAENYRWWFVVRRATGGKLILARWTSALSSEGAVDDVVMGADGDDDRRVQRAHRKGERF